MATNQASQYQRSVWYNRLRQSYNGEYCNHCGKIKRMQVQGKTIRNDLQLIVDRIDNTGGHAIRGNKLADFQLLCRSCNTAKNHPKRKPTNTPEPESNRYMPSSRPASREKIDRGMYEPKYHRNLREKLLDYEHMCLREVKMAAGVLSDGGSIPTCERYLESKLITLVNPKGLYDTFDYTCDSQYCTGVHLYLVGHPPRSLIEAERQTLEQKWEQEYNAYRERWTKHSSTALKYFMELPEFIETHSKLLKHTWR